MSLANYLKMPKRQQVLALLALKWSFRRIQRETGVRRETISGYARHADPNPAKTFAGTGSNPAETFPGSQLSARFVAAAYHDAITEKLDLRIGEIRALSGRRAASFDSPSFRYGPCHVHSA